MLPFKVHVALPTGYFTKDAIVLAKRLCSVNQLAMSMISAKVMLTTGMVLVRLPPLLGVL